MWGGHIGTRYWAACHRISALLWPLYIANINKYQGTRESEREEGGLLKGTVSRHFWHPLKNVCKIVNTVKFKPGIIRKRATKSCETVPEYKLLCFERRTEPFLQHKLVASWIVRETEPLKGSMGSLWQCVILRDYQNEKWNQKNILKI